MGQGFLQRLKRTGIIYMKTIGIIGAMPQEVALLKSRLSNLSEEKVAGLDIFKGDGIIKSNI